MKRSYTILYIDDDHDDLHLISEAFLKYTDKLLVVSASNGRDGFHALEQMKQKGSLPCLIIMDINMPVMNGLETLVKIKNTKEFRHIPVVIFSTSANHTDEEFARKWGADYMMKPSNYLHLENLTKEFVSKCLFEIEERAL